MKIPDICKNSVLLSVVLYSQLLVFTVYLINERTWSAESLGYYTMYIQWIALGSLFALCNLRSFLNGLKPHVTRVAGFLTCMSVAVTVEVFASLIGNSAAINALDMPFVMARRLVACAIVFLILFRIFDLLSVLEKRHIAESSARLDALQSRIRPHFLFNSLNTISELTATQPAQAEEAIEALAMLFRANLETDAREHSLKSETVLCQRYIDLERWRLDSKLKVTFSDNVEASDRYFVPKLLLQPLIENAIVHGVSEAGEVKLSVDIRETSDEISIKVENSRGSKSGFSEGNGIAIDNIKERLFVLYDDKYTFRVKDSGGRYSVLIRLPKRLSRAA